MMTRTMFMVSISTMLPH